MPGSSGGAATLCRVVRAQPETSRTGRRSHARKRAFPRGLSLGDDDRMGGIGAAIADRVYPAGAGSPGASGRGRAALPRALPANAIDNNMLLVACILNLNLVRRARRARVPRRVRPSGRVLNRVSLGYTGPTGIRRYSSVHACTRP
eukprot:SAG31_NODE_7802_length_1594_cov_0.819398_2_plen_146_part_00